MINNALSLKNIVKKKKGVKQVSPWSLNNSINNNNNKKDNKFTLNVQVIVKWKETMYIFFC